MEDRIKKEIRMLDLCYYLNIDENTLKIKMREYPQFFAPVHRFLKGDTSLSYDYLDILREWFFRGQTNYINFNSKRKISVWQRIKRYIKGCG